MQILMEPFSETEIEDTSVTQGRTRPVPHANPVASPGEEAGPSNRTPPVRPYPSLNGIPRNTAAFLEPRFPHCQCERA